MERGIIIRRRSMLAALVAAAALLFAALCLTGCEDKGTNSPKPEPVKDYPVYIGDINRSTLFTYYPVSRRMDTAMLPASAQRGITLSADGKRLYLAARTYVSVVDVATNTVITTLPYSSGDWVSVSPDNRLLAVPSSGLHLLDAATYEVVFEDTIPVLHCEFSRDSKRLYCAEGGTDRVYEVDLTDSAFTVTSTDVGNGTVYYVVPTPDEAKLLLYRRLGTWVYSFEVYDVAQDSIIFSEAFAPGGGRVAVTPDGKYGIYTYPGVTGTDPPPPGTFTVFDIATNEIHAKVSIFDYVDSFGAAVPPIHPAFTPDGRWLVLSGGSQMLQQALFLYDLQDEKLVDYVDLGRNAMLTNPTSQLIK